MLWYEVIMHKKDAQIMQRDKRIAFLEQLVKEQNKQIAELKRFTRSTETP